jgi:large subunit ribosomal protein L35
MPKNKTHKGAKKRFKVTATGKVLRKKAGRRHLLSHKTGKHKRRLRGPAQITNNVAVRMIEAMVQGN